MCIQERERERERENNFSHRRLGVNRIGEVLTDLVKEGLKAVLVFGVPLKATKVEISHSYSLTGSW